MSTPSAPQLDGSSGALTVVRWNAVEWQAKERACRELAARSASDALFLSWDWLTEWWRSFGAALGRTPEILAFYRGGELIGLAPLYHRRLLRHNLLPAHSVQMIGLAWRDPYPPISEYLDVIAAAADLDAVRRACIEALLAESGWSEFVIGLTATAAQWRSAYAACAPENEHYVRELDRAMTYQADLSQGFAAYLRDLSQSTRRSVLHLRKRLASHGDVRLENVPKPELRAGFEDLNRLHLLRWQRPAFSGARLEFHLRVAERAAARGELALSRLSVGGQVVSVLYDLRKGPHQYNIKMGFDPTLSSRLSLGLIHLGYAIERASEREVVTYDFLAGPGRASDFKRLLSQKRYALSCVQILRGPVLTSLYRWRDRVRA